MTKEEAWDKFKETGEIKYYLKYKRGQNYMLKQVEGMILIMVKQVKQLIF